ncbi:MAG: hypothetical protein HOQ07_08395 [Sinomonas sp.]|nr:hypothetical protein [Sinomonas sp.]
MCKAVNVVHLRGYWEDLPVESPNKRKFSPPDEPDVRQWLGVLAVAAGIWIATTGSVGMGLLIALGGLLWGAWMAAQVHQYREALAEYEMSKICLANRHVFTL